MSMILEIGEAELEQMVLSRIMEALPKLIHSAIHKGVSYTPSRKTVNGVTEPARNTKCGQIWQELDLLVVAGVQPTLNQIQRLGAAHGWNANNTKTEYYAWKRFHSGDFAERIAG